MKKLKIGDRVLFPGASGFIYIGSIVTIFGTKVRIRSSFGCKGKEIEFYKFSSELTKLTDETEMLWILENC